MTDRWTNGHKYILYARSNKETDKETDKKISTHTDKETDKKISTHTDKEKWAEGLEGPINIDNNELFFDPNYKSQIKMNFIMWAMTGNQWFVWN
jgi:hypothetical protein